MKDDENYAVGQIFLPDSFANPPAYWNGKLLDVQANANELRRFLPSLFNIISMDPGWKVLGSVGIHVTNSPGFKALGTQARLFDKRAVASRAYNQFANSFINDLMMKSEEIFAGKCVGPTANLEFQARNTQHHHVLLFLEGLVIKHVAQIDLLVSAELPNEQQDP